MPDTVIRRANLDDAAIVARRRVAMFRDMGQVPTEALAGQLLELSLPARSTPPARSSPAPACHIKPQLPRPAPDHATIASGPVPLVLNVYTEPAWRRRGLARAMMTTLMQWAKEEGCDRVVLHASPDGHALYKALGFVPTNEMRWTPR